MEATIEQGDEFYTPLEDVISVEPDGSAILIAGAGIKMTMAEALRRGLIAGAGDAQPASPLAQLQRQKRAAYDAMISPARSPSAIRQQAQQDEFATKLER